MKQFLLVGIAVLFVSANASENPFDLKENFGKIDGDQEVLLSELRKLAESKALAQDKEAAVEAKRAVPALDDVVEKEEIQTHEAVEAQEIEKVKAQRKAEKLEVIAYEKERAEKLANQAENAAILAKANIADERKNKKLPKELSFFQKLIEAKAEGKHRPLEGELKNIGSSKL